MAAMWVSGDSVSVGSARLELRTFAALVGRHPRAGQTVLALEAEGRRLLSLSEVALERGLPSFIKRVCQWGGYPKTAQRVLAQNSFPEVCLRFDRAIGALKAEPPDLRRALRELDRLRHLGASFASKHLRVLRPDVCPVLDSTLSRRLGYPLNERGYAQFSRDCRRVAGLLQRYGVVNPMNRPAGRWFAADVEMALFVHVRESPA
jgi:hypothetical protein